MLLWLVLDENSYQIVHTFVFIFIFIFVDIEFFS